MHQLRIFTDECAQATDLMANKLNRVDEARKEACTVRQNNRCSSIKAETNLKWGSSLKEILQGTFEIAVKTNCKCGATEAETYPLDNTAATTFSRWFYIGH